MADPGAEQMTETVLTQQQLKLNAQAVVTATGDALPFSFKQR